MRYLPLVVGLLGAAACRTGAPPPSAVSAPPGASVPPAASVPPTAPSAATPAAEQPPSGRLTVTYLGVSESMVTGRVVREGMRTRVSNAVVQVPGAGIETLIRADGYFVLMDVPAGAHALEVRHPQWGTGGLTIEVGSPGKLIGEQSGPGGRLVGRIRLPDGQPLGDVQVTTEWEGLPRGASTRVDGSFLFDRIPAGSYELRAERLGLYTVTKQVTVVENAQTEVFFEIERQPPLMRPRPR